MYGKHTEKLENSLFQLKFSAKQVTRLATKAEKESDVQKAKVKKALVDGNTDIAKVYAENAIRKHNESLNYLRMSSRFDAIANRIQTALQMNEAVRNIGGLSKELDKAMKSMDLEKMEKIMSKFESQFEDLDVRSMTMENAMGNATTLSAPESEVNGLIKKVAAEHGLEVNEAILNAPSAGTSIGADASRSAADDALSRRLAALRE
ncbi:unnamed protein product [Calicophoron daubneyi]|uniref:Charged multivesicular body protein 1a n=1 Tax=Calicophoron daubneyi TaxID=300641 RepID=A0AAV2TTU5_CALDB